MNDELLFQQSRCIAHELRNHLSICDLYTEILSRRCDDAGVTDKAVTDALGCIKKSVKVMDNCLLDLKSIGSINPSRCELNRVVGESVLMAQVYKPDAAILFDAQGEIYTDENKLCACLINIIKNALEAGATQVEIVARPDKITVSNNGAPIENPDKIFVQDFTTKPSGSGLGLYICKKNLEAQGAKLYVAGPNTFEIIPGQ